MKTTLKLMVVLCLSILYSCQEAPKTAGNYNLLPLPQQNNTTGLSGLKAADIQLARSLDKSKLPILGKAIAHLKETTTNEAQITYGIDTDLSLGAEGYQLHILEDGITIKAKDEKGLFYAFRTLEQLMIDAKEQGSNLPLTTIEDYPKLAYRAIHLDVKHHLETKQYYYDLMDELASLKINGIIIEIEDKLQFKRQPKVGSSDAFSIEEWKKLSEYAYDRHIEISPLVQGLGHSSFVLKHEIYKDLRDNPESDWAYNPLNEETYKVQFDLYLDAMEAFPHGKYLHVGGDEVHTTGRNSGKSALELQLDWLSRVSKFAEKHQKTPIFWDDMPLKQAGVYNAMFNKKLTEAAVDSLWQKNEHKLLAFLDKFPKNCVYMRWNYSASEAIGNLKAMDWFRKHGFQVMGATAGQTRWVLMPQEESNMNNIKSFASSSIAGGLNGLLLTLWDDDSPHFELYKRGIAAFAEYAWTGEKRNKSAIKQAFRHRTYGTALADSTLAFADALEKPVGVWKNILLKGNARNYLKHTDTPLEKVIPLPNATIGEWSEKHSKRIEKARAMLEITKKIEGQIADAKLKAVRGQYNLEVYEQVNKLTQFTFNAVDLLATYDSAQLADQKKSVYQKIKELPKEFKALRAEFEEVYAKTRQLNKPEDYILDQDGHHHLANQTKNFDWQFYAEMLLLDEIEKQFQ